jgi:preprotein translocase subunit SecG
VERLAVAMEWVYYIARFLQFVICLGLIALVISQTHKAEGLGAVGGSSQGSSFRGRAGHEEILSKYTAWMAVAFMVISLLTFILSERLDV